jgi:hypothetical protein
VLENGLRIAQETGANEEVVSLFAVLHDSRHMVSGGLNLPNLFEALSLTFQIRISICFTRPVSPILTARPKVISPSKPAGTPIDWTLEECGFGQILITCVPSLRKIQRSSPGRISGVRLVLRLILCIRNGW